MRKSRRDSYEQAYNAQAVVDSDGSQLVVATDVVRTPSDANQLEPALARVPKGIGTAKRVLADAGYMNADSFQRLGEKVDLYVALGDKPLPPLRLPTPQEASPKKFTDPRLLAMRKKLASEVGQRDLPQTGLERRARLRCHQGVDGSTPVPSARAEKGPNRVGSGVPGLQHEAGPQPGECLKREGKGADPAEPGHRPDGFAFLKVTNSSQVGLWPGKPRPKSDRLRGRPSPPCPAWTRPAPRLAGKRTGAPRIATARVPVSTSGSPPDERCSSAAGCRIQAARPMRGGRKARCGGGSTAAGPPFPPDHVRHPPCRSSALLSI